jgi:hypothetical protein
MWKGCNRASIPKGTFSRLFLQKPLSMYGCETPLLVDWDFAIAAAGPHAKDCDP